MFSPSVSRPHIIPAAGLPRNQAAPAFLAGQLLHFAAQQALSCLFPLALFLTFALTQRAALPGLYRYDVILLVCLAVQGGMYQAGLETKDEMKVIALFHVAGLGLELFKTHMHCWAYPEPGWTKVAGVPLYSGFMYASVAGYLCQAWRRLDVRLSHWPRGWVAALLTGAIYLNFFSERWLPDARWVLTALVLLVFRRSAAGFAVRGVRYALPMPAAFALIGFFLWMAENIATFFGAWQYPNQHGGWHPVHLAKMSSWSLLVIFSFLIVAQLKRVKEKQAEAGREDTGQGEAGQAGHLGAQSSSSAPLARSG